MTKVHELKIWPEFFDAVVAGTKTFEVRFNDRGFRHNDRLHLREWDRTEKLYTGRDVVVEIIYIAERLPVVCPVDPEYVILGIRPLQSQPPVPPKNVIKKDTL